ncbi:MAG: family 16 glycoside hydrolase [Pirellulaceae bacterium]
MLDGTQRITLKVVSLVLFLATIVIPSFADDQPFCEYLPPANIDNGKTIVLLSGDEEYRSEEAMPMLGKLLSQRFGFHCYVLFSINPETGEIDPNNQINIPGMEKLDDADLVIMSWRFRNPSGMKHFADYFERGKPIIALRTSTHAFRIPKDSDSPFQKYSFDASEWPGGFGKQILGETWVSHHGNHGSESTRGILAETKQKHPVLKGVSDVWGPTDVYGIRELPEDANVLMHGQILAGMTSESVPVEDDRNNPMMPIAWVRELKTDNGVQRLFTTTMGSSTDFESADLRRMVVNAAFWCVGMASEINEHADVDYVDEFKPTPFGFNKFQTGLTPRDFDLKSTGKSQTDDERPFARIDGTGDGWREMTESDFQNVNCHDDTWQWHDGILQCTGQPVGVLRSKEELTNFELSLEWKHERFAGNSGVFVWSPLSSMEKLEPGWLPEGIECQVLDHGYTEQYEKSSGKAADWFTTDGDVFPVGASKMKPFPPLSPNGVRSFPSGKHTNGFGEWNHYYIRAINGEVRLWVNGHEVSGGNECEPSVGYIALESEGSPIQFRNIRLRILK